MESAPTDIISAEEVWVAAASAASATVEVVKSCCKNDDRWLVSAVRFVGVGGQTCGCCGGGEVLLLW